MHVNRRGITFVVLIVAACTLFGGFYGSRIGSAAAASQKDAVGDETSDLDNLLSLLRTHYADETDWEKAIYLGAIPSMLRALDPHSQFFDPESFRRLREEQRGSYAGVGMQIRQFEGATIVDYPFPDTPAFHAGVRPGDVIAAVDGESTEALGVSDVARLVRGKPGTIVHLSLKRPHVGRGIEVDLKRGDIERPSLPLAFELEPGIGYLRITTFNETTAQELDDALEKFGGDRLRGLVLDLRDNSGGLLTAAVHVADRFLAEGQTIVSHHGRASRERSYKASKGQQGDPYPITVLVNCHSASAAEIVAGALQDHDRALIAGTNTFGKGLVQSVFDLSETTGLVLSTARYYTPSGRLIQRPYNNVSLMEYYADPCSDGFHPLQNETRLTDNGRQVYGGGGITPDIQLSELTRRNEFIERLAARRAFEGFAQEFSTRRSRIAPNWDPDLDTYDEFRLFLVRQRIELTNEDFESNRESIRRLLKLHIYTACKDLYSGWRVDTELDPAVRQAVELLPQARALVGGARQVAQKHSTAAP